MPKRKPLQLEQNQSFDTLLSLELVKLNKFQSVGSILLVCQETFVMSRKVDDIRFDGNKVFVTNVAIEYVLVD